MLFLLSAVRLHTGRRSVCGTSPHICQIFCEVTPSNGTPRLFYGFLGWACVRWQAYSIQPLTPARRWLCTLVAVPI